MKDIPKGLIIHVCIPYSDEFEKIVLDYCDQLEPKMVLIHTSCPPGTTFKLWAKIMNLDYAIKKYSEKMDVIIVAHCPINGQHPQMEKDIRRYTMFVGAVGIQGAEVCEYLGYYGINTYLCDGAWSTEYAKLISTEFLRTQIKFFQKMKEYCKGHPSIWAETIEFFKAINYPTFQRAGPIDTPMSGKHCLETNHKVLVDECIVQDD